ncbi:MAG: carboxymuconolactone decarboxylase family protein, partial [Thermodesulfobacteriota bacterium]
MIKNASERMWGDMGPFLQAALDAIDKEVSEIIIDGCFNEIYGREAELDLKTRELCTITMLAALGRSDDLETHLAAAFNLGWDLREIVE